MPARCGHPVAASIKVKPAEKKANALDAAYEDLNGLGKEANAILKALQKAVAAGAREMKKGDECKADSHKKAVELDKALVTIRSRQKTEGKLKLA